MTPNELENELEFCIWNARYDRLAALPSNKPNTWAGSIHSQVLTFGLRPDLTARFSRHDPFLACAAILMVKDEADIIRANLDWLYHIGVRHFAIIDNDSQDATATEIRRFETERRDVNLLLEHDTIVAHFQAEKTKLMCDIAHKAWPHVEWHIPVDADEFLNTRNGLRSLMFVPDEIEALTIPKVIHFQTRSVETPAAAGILPNMPVRSTPFAVPPKIILRASADLSVSKGNHWVISGAGRPACYDGGLTYGFFHREFQTRSFAQFLSKVRNGGAAVLAANALGREVGGQHWLAWHRLLTEGGEGALRAEYEKVAFREPGPDYVVDRFAGADT